MGVVTFDVLACHKGFGIFFDLNEVDSLSLGTKDTAAVALAIDVIFGAHFNRTFVALIFLEIAWQILGIVDFLNFQTNGIDGLGVFVGADGQGTAEIVKA